MKAQTVKIGKTNFKFRRFPVFEANRRLTRLIQVISPIAGSILSKVGISFFNSSDDQPKQVLDKNNPDFFDEFDKLARINPEMLEKICDIVLDGDFIQVQLRDGSYVNYGEDVLDDVFEEDPSLLWVLILEAIKFNFSYFFTRIVSVFSDDNKETIKSIIQK